MPKLFFMFFAILPLVVLGNENRDIPVGQVVSISSPLVGQISAELTSGYEAYFAEVNRQGGIHGKKIRLIQKDDGYNADRTLGLTRELIYRDNVVALAGFLGTPGPSLVVREKLLTDNDIAFVGPSTGASKLLAEKNVFPVRATYEAELAEIVAHAAAMQHRRIALVAWNAGAGPSLADAFPGIVKSGGLELAHRVQFDASAAGEGMAGALATAFAPVAESKPDAVVLIAGGNALYESVRFVRSKFPSSLPLYTLSSVNWQDLVANVSRENARGIMISQAVPYPYSPQLPIVKQYMECMQRAGRAINYYSFEGYLGAAVIADAFRRAGPAPTRSRVLAALTSIGVRQFGGFEVDYSAERRRGFARPEITMITAQGRLLR